MRARRGEEEWYVIGSGLCGACGGGMRGLVGVLAMGVRKEVAGRVRDEGIYRARLEGGE